MKKRFNLTYDIVTPSNDSGDSSYRGFLPKSGSVPFRNNMPKTPALFTLREAFEIMRNNWSNGPEADSMPCDTPRWITVYSQDDNMNSVSLSMHLDSYTRDICSHASARRIARLFGIKCKA